MDYVALYRKYRPSTLDEMVGQSEIKTILASSVLNGTISHAYLFSGPRGTGKTSTAKIFARMVNCTELKDGVPCGCCESCQSILNNSDVVEIDAASNNGVDEIRDLREKVNLVPSVCKYKVYIIDEVHMLTTQAFNALLKTLEEPPKHVIFILATTEYHKVPLTITSRCQKFQFNKLQVDENVKKLREIADNENISITDEALVEIAKISDGGMRDSINFLDQLRSFKSGDIVANDVFEVCGNVSSLEIVKLLEYLKNYQSEEVVNYLEEIGNNGKNYGKFLEDILSFLRDVILFKNNVNRNFIKSDLDNVKIINDIYELKDIYLVIDIINKLIEKLKFVSRQSVVVVVDFLYLMNEFKNKEMDDNSNKLTFIKKEEKNVPEVVSFKSSNINENSHNMSNNSLQNNSKNYKSVDRTIKNKDIIINNVLALADKKLKTDLQSKWMLISNYLIDNKFSVVASKLTDTILEVAGKGYLLFTVDYESLIDNIYCNYKLCSELIELIMGAKYHFVFITKNEWNILRDKYINDYRAGKKYDIKELLEEDNFDDINVENNDKEVTVVDKLFELVGEDCVEIK